MRKDLTISPRARVHTFERNRVSRGQNSMHTCGYAHTDTYTHHMKVYIYWIYVDVFKQGCLRVQTPDVTNTKELRIAIVDKAPCTCIHMYTYICRYTYIRICVYISVYVCVHACMYLCVQVYACTHIYIYYVYTHTYIHTYMHTYMQTDRHTDRQTDRPTCSYITLHYTTLHYITLHSITLHCIALHCSTLDYTTLH